jgi:hypothetical protein
MNIQVKILVNALEAKEASERIVKENVEWKLDSYLKKYSKGDAEWIVEVKVKKNKKWLFNWVLNVNLDWDKFNFSREDYNRLDDLINHLFDHLKETLSKK